MKANILMLFSSPYRKDAQTIKEHYSSFEKYSKFNVYNINIEKLIPKFVYKNSFEIVIFHYSLFGSLPFRKNDRLFKELKKYKSYKIAFFQDEMQYGNERIDFLTSLGINCVFSLLNKKYHSEIYLDRSNVSEVYETLTGYIDDDLIEIGNSYFKELHERTIDISYRARSLPFRYGAGGQEKTEIARGALIFFGAKYNLDISTNENDRLYGTDWYKLLADSKSVLGVEAGTSIFDIDGTITKSVNKEIDLNPDITFQEIYDKVLFKYESKIEYRTISPRIFEAAAFKVAQIMFEGEYQNILEPWKHYLPLKKDFSNISEIESFINSKEKIESLIETTYRDIILSRKYTYKNFISQFDGLLFSKGYTPNDIKIHKPDLLFENSSKSCVLVKRTDL